MALTVEDLIKSIANVRGSLDADLDVDYREPIYDALQQALALIDTHRSWKFLEAFSDFDTVATTQNYDLKTVNSNAMADFGTLYSMHLDTIDSAAQFRVLQKRDYNYYLRCLRDAARTASAPTVYWIKGVSTVSLWPIPSAANTINTHYKRYHGEVRKDCTIYVPDVFEMVLIHLGKQCLNGMLDTVDKMMAADPYISTMWRQMVAAEGNADPSAEWSGSPVHLDTLGLSTEISAP